MAIFKPGDPARIKWIGYPAIRKYPFLVGKPCIVETHPIEHILSCGIKGYEVFIPGHPHPDDGPWWVQHDQLEPIKPTDIDEWARDQVKRVTKHKKPTFEELVEKHRKEKQR